MLSYFSTVLKKEKSIPSSLLAVHTKTCSLLVSLSFFLALSFLTTPFLHFTSTALLTHSKLLFIKASSPSKRTCLIQSQSRTASFCNALNPTSQSGIFMMKSRTRRIIPSFRLTDIVTFLRFVQPRTAVSLSVLMTDIGLGRSRVTRLMEDKCLVA